MKFHFIHKTYNQDTNKKFRAIKKQYLRSLTKKREYVKLFTTVGILTTRAPCHFFNFFIEEFHFILLQGVNSISIVRGITQKFGV